MIEQDRQHRHQRDHRQQQGDADRQIGRRAVADADREVKQLAEQRAAVGLNGWKGGDEVQGEVVFIGSISSQGNRGQVSYASTKAGLEGAAATMRASTLATGAGSAGSAEALTPITEPWSVQTRVVCAEID
mgnify:CR=1 FL=1